MLEVKEHFPYEFKFSPKKVIKYRGWKTKDEKAYLILVESKDEDGGVTDDDLYKVLIEPCIEDKNIYLSSFELQMLLIEIRKKSMGETFTIKYTCQNEKCNSVNEVNVNFKDIIEFKPENITIFKDGDFAVEFGDIKNIKLYKEKILNQNLIEQKFIELIMRIEKIYIGDEIHDSFSFDEVYNYINNLDVKVYDKLLDYFMENSANLTLSGTFKCMSCKEDNKFVFDEVPNFLGDW